MPGKYDTHKKTILLVGDLFLIILSVYLSVFLRFFFINVLDRYTGATTFVVASYVLSFYIFDLYNLSYRFKGISYLARFFIAVIAGTSLIAMVFYLLPLWKFGRGILLINMFIVSFLTFTWRVLFEYFYEHTNKPRKIVIVGAGFAGKTIYHTLINNKDYEIVGFLDDHPENINKLIGKHKVIGDSSLLIQMSKGKKIDVAVIAVTHQKKTELLQSAIYARMEGVEIYEMPMLYEYLTGKLPVKHIDNLWFLYSSFAGVSKNIYTVRIKRILDFTFSICGLVASLPITITTAIAIKLDSKGPIFFSQKREGLRGQVFEVIKFRSMTTDAEINGPVWAEAEDPRVTKIGKLIRKWRIDEIPQMWNVLKGEMSLIGPRPERPEFIITLQKEIPYYSLRHSVRPGITGWAQVNYRYGASKEDALEKLQYDLYYIKNHSPFLDLHILLKTIRIVLFRTGAR